MRIGYITYYNTTDNLRIALEDNLIEISIGQKLGSTSV